MAAIRIKRKKLPEESKIIDFFSSLSLSLSLHERNQSIFISFVVMCFVLLLLLHNDNQETKILSSLFSIVVDDDDDEE